MVNVTIEDLTILAGAIADSDIIEMERPGAPSITRKVTKINFVTDIDNADIAAGAAIATSKLADAANFALINQANTYGAGFTQTFSGDATNAPININELAADPSTLMDGDIWLRSTGEIKIRAAAITERIVTELQAQILTNKTIDGDDNTILDINETQMNVSVGVSGTVLTSIGVGSPPTYQAAAGGGKTFAVVVKKVDQTVNNSITFVEDDELSVALQANKVYAYFYMMDVNSLSTADWKYRVSIPTGAIATVSLDLMRRLNIQTTQDATNTTITVNANVDQMASSNGRIVMGSTAGNFVFEWAQRVAIVTDTIVFKGSYLIIWEQDA